MAEQWIIPESINPLAARAVAKRFGLSHPLVAQLLLRRGLVDDQKIIAFLNPDLAHLEDPFRLRMLERALSVLDEALRSGRRIVIYGDYDVDGTTGATLLQSYLRAKGGDVTSFIPFRHEGYGLSRASIDRILVPASTRLATLERRIAATTDVNEKNLLINQLATLKVEADDWRVPELLVTVDCGTNSRAEVDYARSRGLEVIVTDHHLPIAGKETTGIVVNPHSAGDDYPNKGLAGVGVAYKLIAAHHGKHPTANLDLVALGTIADVMPLINENRILVKAGLERLSHTKRVGLQELFTSMKINPAACPHGADGDCYPVNAETVAFQIAPRINAIGRMGLDPHLVVELLSAPDDEEGRARAAEIATLLNNVNTERREKTNRLVDQAMRLVDPDAPIIVLQMDIEKGLAGLIAGRLAAEFNRPAIVVNQDGHGSARSIPEIDLLQILQKDYSNLVTAAGHALAMGISNVTDVESLKKALEHHSWPENIGTRELLIDAVCRLEDLDVPLLRALDRLEPTGAGNPAPLFVVSGVEIADKTTSKDGRHAFLVLRDPESGLIKRGIWFGHGADAPQSELIVDVACRPMINRSSFDNSESVELSITAVRPTKERLPLTLQQT